MKTIPGLLCPDRGTPLWQIKNFLTEIIDADLAEGKIRCGEIHTRLSSTGAQRLPAHRQRQGDLYQLVHRKPVRRYRIALFPPVQPPPRRHQLPPAGREEYVNSIIEDLHWLGADPQRRHLLRQRLLDKCYEYAEKLILEEKAYVDDLTRDEMQGSTAAATQQALRPSPWNATAPRRQKTRPLPPDAGEFKEGERPSAPRSTSPAPT